MLAFADAARAEMGVMPSPRSGGGPISLLMGEPPGLVPGGPGDRHDPHLCQNGRRPAAREWRLKSPQRAKMIPEAYPPPSMGKMASVSPGESTVSSPRRDSICTPLTMTTR